jgi:transcriptional regulator with XRE-family HTH domain
MSTIPDHHQNRLDYIASFIRNYRMNVGRTQKELCQSDNSVHHNTLIRLEKGKNISLLKLFDVLDALELSPNDLFLDVD